MPRFHSVRSFPAWPGSRPQTARASRSSSGRSCRSARPTLGGALLIAAAVASPTAHAFTLEFESAPAESGPGHAYSLASSGECGVSARCVEPMGDPIRNEQGFNCGGTDNYQVRLNWEDDSGTVHLLKMRMGRTHDGRYRCEADDIAHFDTSPLHRDDVVRVRCAADGSCRITLNDVTAGASRQPTR